MHHLLPALPNIGEIESRAVLKKLARAHQAPAELKGVLAGIPHESILIDTLSLREAKDRSAIETTVTTQGEFFRSESRSRSFMSAHPDGEHFPCNIPVDRNVARNFKAGGTRQIHRWRLLPS